MLHYVQSLDLPWIRNLRADPTVRPFEMTSLTYPGPNGPNENAFFGKTLTTSTTFRKIIPLRHYPQGSHFPELLLVVSLGPDVNSHTNYLSGAAAAALFDEAMAVASELAYGEAGLELNFFTRDLSMRFRKPVPSPGAILIRSKVEKMEGKRTWTIATIEDGSGTVFCESKATFVQVDSKPKL